MLSYTKSRLAGKKLLQTLFFFLLVTQICFAQWFQLGLEDKSIKDIAARNSTIFAVATDSGSVYRSTDDGNSWTLIVDSKAVDIATVVPGGIFMIKEDSLYSSSDGGDTWNRLDIVGQLPPPPSGMYINPKNISISNSENVFCGLRIDFPPLGHKTVFALSEDNGQTWGTPGWDILGGLLFDFRDQFVITVGEYISTGGGVGMEVHLSSDYGNMWSHLGEYPEPYPRALSIYSDGNILFGSSPGTTGYDGGIFLSMDSCTSWIKVSTLIPEIGLSLPAGGMLVGTDGLGVFLFSADGDSMGSCNLGLSNLNIRTLTIDNNNYVYAGTGNGVWRRPLLEITSVEEEQIDEMPTEFLLSNNFPNPFNPSTKIKYSVPQSSQVQIKVFDVLGNEIETIVNEEKPAGSYEITWNAAALPSGVYFYQLRAGTFIETKKMLLLK